jgi:hypothetical protein
MVPPVVAPRRASAQVPVVTRRGESGSIVGVYIVGVENKEDRMRVGRRESESTQLLLES